MSRREIVAITAISCVMALAVEGHAISQPDSKTSMISKRVVSPLQKVEKLPDGPCGWFAPENCPDREPRPEPTGCTENSRP